MPPKKRLKQSSILDCFHSSEVPSRRISPRKKIVPKADNSEGSPVTLNIPETDVKKGEETEDRDMTPEMREKIAAAAEERFKLQRNMPTNSECSKTPSISRTDTGTSEVSISSNDSYSQAAAAVAAASDDE